MVEIPVTAGEAVVRQGDPADRFYIIESGAFTVTQAAGTGAEPVVLRKLGADAVFGEIGLLNRTPRTATVTADTDGLLLALEGEAFLRSRRRLGTAPLPPARAVRGRDRRALTRTPHSRHGDPGAPARPPDVGAALGAGCSGSCSPTDAQDPTSW